MRRTSTTSNGFTMRAFCPVLRWIVTTHLWKGGRLLLLPAEARKATGQASRPPRKKARDEYADRCAAASSWGVGRVVASRCEAGRGGRAGTPSRYGHHAIVGPHSRRITRWPYRTAPFAPSPGSVTARSGAVRISLSRGHARVAKRPASRPVWFSARYAASVRPSIRRFPPC